MFSIFAMMFTDWLSSEASGDPIQIRTTLWKNIVWHDENKIAHSGKIFDLSKEFGSDPVVFTTEIKYFLMWTIYTAFEFYKT